MAICEADYCDFVVWKEDDVIILCLNPDSDFITDVIEKVTAIFKHGVLVELLGKWYTKTPASSGLV